MGQTSQRQEKHKRYVPKLQEKTAPRHTTEHTINYPTGISVSFEPEVYGVTSWLVRWKGKVIFRYAWEALAVKETKWFMSRMG